MTKGRGPAEPGLKETRMKGRMPKLIGGLILAAMPAGAASAQSRIPGDPHAGDPAGIVDQPCPAGRTIDNAGGYAMWQLHMLTRDFGQLCRYAAQNAALKARGEMVRVVFMGDSITDNWINLQPEFFAAGLVDRGIGGQTTPQMLVRFRQDVLELRPAAVHIMAGTNDIAGNSGAATMATVQGHIRSMAELARAHGIKVILASVPPAASFPWSPDRKPTPQIRAMNAWLEAYARQNGFVFVDYYRAMADAAGGMKPGLSSDGVHPTREGYRVMAPLARAAIRAALGGRR
jgi:lysophospholipase L1-like esterase